MATSLTLCTVPVFFATSEGQTRRIADRFATLLRGEGVDSYPYDVGTLDGVTLDWSRVRGVILGASLHAGKHQPAAHAFASSHASRLGAVPSLFFSVSLAAASTHQAEVASAQRIADDFPVTCSWRADTVVSLAGRLAYTQYGFLKRWLMTRIARKEGAPTDTSRDYEFTDWTRVETVAKAFAARVKVRAAA
jgi:menaquinone-dependent protoporphyrinogen oxidase